MKCFNDFLVEFLWNQYLPVKQFDFMESAFPNRKGEKKNKLKKISSFC